MLQENTRQSIRAKYRQRRIEIYTDGSCYHKTRCGGIGVYMKCNGLELRYSESHQDTTISRMELLAVITALYKVKDKRAVVVIYSDSQYVVNIARRLKQLKLENNSLQQVLDRSGYKNSDLWRVFCTEYELIVNKGGVAQFIWVKGHSDNEGNIIADQLAGEGYSKAKQLFSDQIKKTIAT